MNTLDLLSLSLDALDRLLPDQSWGLGEHVIAACLLEASAPKAGNVHPEARFDDMDYEDFRRSAQTTGEVFNRSRNASCGSLILSAVQATHDEIGKNTNLGIVLLLAPLVVTARPHLSNSGPAFCVRWRQTLATTLGSLTADDSAKIYQAISIANPGGLGRVEQMDVQHSPPEDLMAAMRFAAAWDDVAKQYVTNFSDVFALSVRIDFYRQSKQLGWFDSLSIVHVERLASHGDTLIARKNNEAIVEDVKKLATLTLQTGSSNKDDWMRRPELKQLDDFLRADGHRRNPGTTADLLAAAVFVSLLCEYNTEVPK